MGHDEKEFKEHFKEKAAKDVKAQLVLAKILSQETVEVTEEEIKSEIEAIAKIYNVKEENFYDRFSESDKEYVKEKISIRKIVQKMVDEAKMKD